MLPVRWLKWLKLTRIDGRPERQAAASAPSWAWAAAGSAPSAAARSPARKIFNFISQTPRVGPNARARMKGRGQGRLPFPHGRPDRLRLRRNSGEGASKGWKSAHPERPNRPKGDDRAPTCLYSRRARRRVGTVEA